MKKVVLVVLVAVLVAVGFAYAAANTVPVTGAGDGEKTISGYDVYNVHYTLASDPTKIGSVTFTITTTSGAAAPATVKIKLVSDSNTWYSCDAGQNFSWTCSVGDVSVYAANELRVVAAQ